MEKVAYTIAMPLTKDEPSIDNIMNDNGKSFRTSKPKKWTEIEIDYDMCKIVRFDFSKYFLNEENDGS